VTDKLACFVCYPVLKHHAQGMSHLRGKTFVLALVPAIWSIKTQESYSWSLYTFFQVFNKWQ